MIDINRTLLILILASIILDEAQAINCYGYRTESYDDLGMRNRIINCDRQFRIPSHACFKAEYINNGREMALGYCGDTCPAMFKERECIYQEGTENHRLLQEFTGMTNAVSVCCCERDFCNSSLRVSLQNIFYILPLSIVMNFRFLF